MDAIGGLLYDALVHVINALVVAIAAVLSVLMALLPSLPTAPSLGAPEWLQWLNWFYPVGTVLQGLVAFVACWVTFLLARVGLKWARAL